jgi:hypothetical protein
LHAVLARTHSICSVHLLRAHGRPSGKKTFEKRQSDSKVLRCTKSTGEGGGHRVNVSALVRTSSQANCMLHPDFNKWARRERVSSVSFMVPGRWSGETREQVSASKDFRATIASLSIFRLSASVFLMSASFINIIQPASCVQAGRKAGHPRRCSRAVVSVTGTTFGNDVGRQFEPV